MEDLPLVNTVAVAFTAAWLLGLLTQRLGLSPIVGYLLAGVAIGPHTPGFEGDVHVAHQLAEMGVILLMFGVGLHFHLNDLLAVKTVAIPGAIVQSLVATLFGLVVFMSFGLPLASAAVIGMAMAVASTVVLMRVLMDADALNSPPGHIAVGWLLVEDVITVIVLMLIPVLGSAGGAEAGGTAMGLWTVVGLALLKLVVLVAIVMVVGSRVIPWVMVQVARLRSRELFTLTVLVFSISMATAAYTFFGASMALGAFLAGMLVAQSPVSHQAAADALPMRDAFAVLFFVSVGMLFDPACLVREPLMILAALVIILIVKPLAALIIVAVLGRSVRTALTVALGLAQIGEFSFILSEVARRQHIMPLAGHNVLIASAIISITLNPLLFRSLVPCEAWLRRRAWLWSLLNGRADRRSRDVNLETESHIKARVSEGERLAVVVGFGPVGRSVHRLLSDAGLTTVVIDLNMDTISELSGQGLPAVFGDASHESILQQAGMRHASHLVLTLPDPSTRIAIVTAARSMNATARVFVRAHYLREREDLEKAGASAAVFEEGEAAVALARLVLADTGADRDVIERKVRDLRLQLILENMSNIRAQRVRTIMVPWTRVMRLSTRANREDVLQEIARQRFSHWPVTEPRTGRVVGYLLAKDMLADAGTDGNWTRLIHPLNVVRSDDDVESTLVKMQQEGTAMCVVEDSGAPVGLITLEDILGQIVGRIEVELPDAARDLLRDALAAGEVVLELNGQTAEAVIRELVGAIRPGMLPPELDVAERALAREREISTDLGVGVAIPHARCPSLKRPILVVGRSAVGIAFVPGSHELVRIVFLLVVPEERPDVQLSLLAQLARIAGSHALRERLLEATTAHEVIATMSQEAAGDHASA